MINYRRQVFFCILLFAYFIGGTINHFAPSIKLAYLVLLGLPFLFKIKKSDLGLLVIASFLAFEFFLSSAINNTGIVAFAQYLRLVYIPVAIKLLVDRSINDINSIRFKKLLILLGTIQLPIVLVQQTFYETLSRYSVIPMQPGDYDFGTFGLSSDFSMSFYLCGLTFLLLHAEIFDFPPLKKFFLSGWFTLTILIANASICYLIICLIWLAFIWKSLRNIKTSLMYSSMIAAVLAYFISSGNFIDRLTYLTGQFSLHDANQQIASFTAGNYTRMGGLLYFLNEPFKWIGDGPLHYYNPLTRQYVLGITGHLLSFYAEVGFLGLVLSYLFCFHLLPRKTKLSSPIAIWFISLLALSLTTNIIADASVMLTFCIIGTLFSLSQKYSVRSKNGFGFNYNPQLQSS